MKYYDLHLFLSAFQELQILTSIRPPSFVSFTAGNLSGRYFLSLTLFFHEHFWSWSGSWIKAILKILLDTPVKYELPFNIWGWIKNFSLDHSQTSAKLHSLDFPSLFSNVSQSLDCVWFSLPESNSRTTKEPCSLEECVVTCGYKAKLENMTTGNHITQNFQWEIGWFYHLPPHRF